MIAYYGPIDSWVIKGITMDNSLLYIVIALVAIAIVALLLFFVGKGKGQNRLTPLAGMAFGFILAGILFGENRVLGYSLLGIGVVLAVVDMFIRSKRE